MHWPCVDKEQRKVVLSQEQFTMLVGGIDLTQTRERKWFRKRLVDESSESRKTA